MTASDDIVSKADAFMHRPRPVVAGGEDADLPLLTEVVAIPSAQMGRGESARQISPPPGLSEETLAALTQALDTWLESEVPIVMARVLDGVVNSLSDEVSARARAQLLPRLLAALEPPSQGE